LQGLRTRVSVELVYGDKVVLDETGGKLLLLIERCGSILCAARSLGLAYSRAWDRISRIERILGEKIIDVRRGGRRGGGARLTSAGRELLARFLEAYRSVHGSDPVTEPVIGGNDSRPDILLYAGSNDPALQRLLGELRDRGLVVEAHWLGSLKGIAALVLGEADLAGIHVLDPGTGEYNRHVVEALGAGTELALIRGYMRLQGFVTRTPMGLEEIVEGLLSGRLRLINRAEGTGTRILLEHFLRQEARRRGIEARLSETIRGWDNVAHTHVEVAEQVARGNADVGLTVKAAASLYGLYFAPIAWEYFDFVTTRKLLSTNKIKAFLDIMCSERLHSILGSLPGYRVLSDTCRIIPL